MSPVYYLAQAYSNNPDQAFSLAVNYTERLREKGYVVFSPVLHTHNYHICRLTGAYNNDEGKRVDKIRNEDYVAWDLAILEAMCLPLTIDETLPKRVVQLDEFCELAQFHQYQPNLVMLFAPTCFSTCDEHWDEDDDEDRFAYTDKKENDYWWVSKGAKREFDWAKAHHVRCLLLSEFLEGRDVEL